MNRKSMLPSCRFPNPIRTDAVPKTSLNGSLGIDSNHIRQSLLRGLGPNSTYLPCADSRETDDPRTFTQSRTQKTPCGFEPFGQSDTVSSPAGSRSLLFVPEQHKRASYVPTSRVGLSLGASFPEKNAEVQIRASMWNPALAAASLPTSAPHPNRRSPSALGSLSRRQTPSAPLRCCCSAVKRAYANDRHTRHYPRPYPSRWHLRIF